MLLACRGNSIANDETGIVDRFGDGENLKAARADIGDGIEVDHLSVREQKGVHRTILRGRVADDLVRCICAQRPALRSAQRSQIGDSFIRITKSVVGRGIVRVGDSGSTLARTWDRGTARTPKGSQVEHLAIGVEKRMTSSVGGFGDARHLTGGIDTVSGAGRSTEGAQIDGLVKRLSVNCWGGGDENKDRTEA